MADEQKTAASALIEALLADTESIEGKLEKLTREASRPVCYPMFQTRRGLLHLEELNDDEARHFAARGKLNEAEIREWWTWRERRLGYPAEVRAAMFMLKARRAGFHRLAVFHDGRVVLG